MPDYKYPFLIPHPARLTQETDQLKEVEESGWFSNFGPKCRLFEERLVEDLFDGKGHSLTSTNGTLALIIAIRYVLEKYQKIHKTETTNKRKYVVVPSFTFVATAQAAIWNGLTPLFCDVDVGTWLPSCHSIESLLEKYKNKVAVVIPYATFGNNLPIRDYEAIEEKYGVPVVVDAAASLGSRTIDNRHFGYGSSIPIVFSLHATKTFSTAEGGLIYSNDKEAIATMRSMSNFGFNANRETVNIGLNSKMPEVIAVLGLAKLREFQTIVSHRQAMASAYWKILRDHNFQFQDIVGEKPPYQFFPAVLPKESSNALAQSLLIEKMKVRGIEVRRYFAPPLHKQSYFAQFSSSELRNTDQVSSGIICLPLHDYVQKKNIVEICDILVEEYHATQAEVKKAQAQAA